MGLVGHCHGSFGTDLASGYVEGFVAEDVALVAQIDFSVDLGPCSMEGSS